MGVVYLARDPQIERTLALKTVRFDGPSQSFSISEAKARFLKEAKISGRLQHPNIVTVFDVGEDEGVLYLAMEYISGGALNQRLTDGLEFPIAERIRILSEVADALAHAHQRGVIHRDVKPANILLTEASVAKVTDFGIGKLLTGDTDLTSTGQMVGSPAYMSPEQIRGDKLDVRSDIFSLGVVLYQTLTLKKPFPADTLTTLVYQILHNQPEDPLVHNGELPPEITQIALKCLAKNREARYGDAVELADDLRAVIGIAPLVSTSGLTESKVGRARKQAAAAASVATPTLQMPAGASPGAITGKEAPASGVPLADVSCVAADDEDQRKDLDDRPPLRNTARRRWPGRPPEGSSWRASSSAASSSSGPRAFSAGAERSRQSFPFPRPLRLPRPPRKSLRLPKWLPSRPRTRRRRHRFRNLRPTPAATRPLPPAGRHPCADPHAPAEADSHRARRSDTGPHADAPRPSRSFQPDETYITRRFVKMNVSPSQARVFLNGRYIGTADDWDDAGGGALLAFTSTGKQRLRLAHPGRRDVTVDIVVAANAVEDRVEVERELEKGSPGGPTGPDGKIPRPDYQTVGLVRFEVDPPSATVVVDDHDMGSASRFQAQDLQFRDQGVYDVLLMAPGYQARTVRILVSPSTGKERVLVREKLRRP